MAEDVPGLTAGSAPDEAARKRKGRSKVTNHQDLLGDMLRADLKNRGRRERRSRLEAAAP